MSINMFRDWKPIELRNAIQECSTYDANSALSAAATLCSMVHDLQEEIAQLKNRIEYLEKDLSAREFREELAETVALWR